jgi:N-acetylmuramoyl-L-alanine amidase
MMGKGFQGIEMARKIARLVTLLAIAAGVSSPLVAAEIREVRIAATDIGTRVVLELSGPVKHKAFVLDDPARVVLDVSKSTLRSELPVADALITALRSGALPHNGTRLVFEVKGPVTIQTSTLAATRDSAERLVLDINGPGAARLARAVPVAPDAPGSTPP